MHYPFKYPNEPGDRLEKLVSLMINIFLLFLLFNFVMHFYQSYKEEVDSKKKWEEFQKAGGFEKDPIWIARHKADSLRAIEFKKWHNYKTK